MPIDAVWIAVAFSGAAALLAAVAAFRSRPPDPALALFGDALDDLRRDLELLRTALSDDLRRSRYEADARAKPARGGRRSPARRICAVRRGIAGAARGGHPGSVRDAQ